MRGHADSTGIPFKYSDLAIIAGVLQILGEINSSPPLNNPENQPLIF
jgi:hypothetical protein